MLIALDTSTTVASIALATEDTLLAELTWSVGQRHGSELTQRLDWLLTAHGLTMAQATGIAVATGPGSFNGARVAVATAKTLAFALGVPLYAHATLDVIAWGARLAPDPIWALLDAGRGEVYAACYNTRYNKSEYSSEYEPAAAHWAPIGGVADGYLMLPPAELVERVRAASAPGRERVVFCGEWREETQVTLTAALGEQARFTSPLTTRRAGSLAELAFARAASSAPDDPAAVEPLYLRRPSITTSTQRRGMQPPVLAPATQLEQSERVDLSEHAKQSQHLHQPSGQADEQSTQSSQASHDGQRQDTARRGKQAPGGEGTARALRG
ncbi:MAG: tRNA (adenosine(37)-N6)-threonylcarbamoyltransferase complex dimerization subunit type 1 TsaB [Ktedonobacterales bacterium]